MNVHFLPALTAEDALEGSCVVVIDVLRATTTLAYALAAGAKEILPCQGVEEARHTALEHSGSLLGGERGGRRIEGFDLGNSPGEYISDVVRQKAIVFTTTNGTKAMLRCRRAQHVLLGSFANLSAVVDISAEHPRLDILCAGTRGEVTREDVLCAGAMVEQVSATRHGRSLNDQAQIAWDCWQAISGHTSLEECLRQTQGGRNLFAIGLQDDIRIAAQVDRIERVPQLDIKTWRIA